MIMIVAGENVPGPSSLIPRCEVGIPEVLNAWMIVFTTQVRASPSFS